MLRYVGAYCEGPDHCALQSLLLHCRLLTVGQDSSVGIVTSYGLDDPGIESRLEGEICRTRPDQPWGPPSLLYNGYWVFSGVK
jgi:hypothetical protein